MRKKFDEEEVKNDPVQEIDAKRRFSQDPSAATPTLTY